MRFRFLIPVLLLLLSCSEDQELTLFEMLDAGHTGIDFRNSLIEQEGLDVFRYRNYYNGAGVGIADLNGNGLPDIYLVSNQGPNRLYINKGDFKFEDVTEAAGVAGSRPWSSGVTIADVNGNGLPDIYVTNAGNVPAQERANELFINNGDGTFTERAEEFGLDDTGYGIHAAFFDFNRNGRLDCYVLNNSPVPISGLSLTNIRGIRDEHGGDRLYRNDDGKFVDVSEEMGIYGSVIGFGLDITLLDVNDNGWTDIYISNDFFERDYLYINRKGEYFSEELESYIDLVSHASMGADAADLTNNGLPDIYTTEMLPEPMDRRKRMIRFENDPYFQYKREQGFYNQFMRNALHINNGDGTFLELGRYANVHATDWSWTALIFDMNNDSRKEIFVTNGIYKDLIDQDFLDYFGSEENLESAREGVEADFQRFVEKMPSNPISNYAFSRPDTVAGPHSDLAFVNMASDWGLASKAFSSGAAFADLNNNGALDLVVNNVDDTPFIYRNHSDTFTGNRYLALHLKGHGKNTHAIGAKVIAYSDGKKITQYQYPHRGFLSTSDFKLVLGLGMAGSVDSLHVVWDPETMSRYYDLPVDTTLTLSAEHSRPRDEILQPRENPSTIFTKIPFDYRHRENDFNEFVHGNLVYHKLSVDGPAVARADLNGNGLDDFFIGGATGYPGMLFMNNGDDTFRQVPVSVFEEDRYSEDVDALFFDANNNGLMDLYVVSGGVEYPGNRERFTDRLYILEGFDEGYPVYSRSNDMPRIQSSGCCVRASDFNGNGHVDLFVGSRSIPGQYGRPPDSHLLINEGNGVFSDGTTRFAPQLRNLGMVTDAVWADYNGNGLSDLVIAGDWMPLVIFENRGDYLQRRFNLEGLENTEGWWRSLEALDLTGDGNVDFVAGNFGTNSMFRADRENPVRLYFSDFSGNGLPDHVYTYKKDGTYYPWHNRHDLSAQLGFINERFPTHSEFSIASVNDIFTTEELAAAAVLDVYLLESTAFINLGNGRFKRNTLPAEAQFSPVFDINADDFDGDGNIDLLLVGNFSGVKHEEGFYDANRGQLYKIGPDGNLAFVEADKTGLRLRGDVRKSVILDSGNNRHLVTGKNDDYVEIFRY